MIAATLHPGCRRNVRTNGRWVRREAARIVATVEASRSTWQDWHVRAEAFRVVRAAEVPADRVDEVVGRLVHAALTRHSIRLAPPPDDIVEPAQLRRLDGQSVYSVAGDTWHTSARILAAEQRLVDAAGRVGGHLISDAVIDVALLEAEANRTPLNAGQAALVQAMSTSGPVSYTHLDVYKRQILHRHATWHVLRQLRAVAAKGPIGHYRHQGARHNLRVAAAFLQYLADHEATLPGCSQGLLDQWHAQHRTQEAASLRPFLRWAISGRHMPRLRLSPIPEQQTPPISHQQRLDLIRRVHDGDGLDLTERVIGLLILLYAQSLARITRLTIDDVITDEHGCLLYTSRCV